MKSDSKDSSPEQQELYSTTTDKLSPRTAAKAITTRDPDEIRRWAARHRAEPATGEATASGPATTQVTDGGTGLRFNYPGFAPFRSITWDEWFEHFDQHGLAFVYEEDVVDRAYALWQARGAEPGQDRADWFEAERQLGGSTGRPMGRYRIVSAR